MKVSIDDAAMEQIERAREWWNANRSIPIALFDAALDHVLHLIGEWPHAAGAVVSNARRKGVRRCHLEPIGYLLFYVVQRNEVRVIRFRHARRRPLRF